MEKVLEKERKDRWTLLIQKSYETCLYDIGNPIWLKPLPDIGNPIWLKPLPLKNPHPPISADFQPNCKYKICSGGPRSNSKSDSDKMMKGKGKKGWTDRAKKDKTVNTASKKNRVLVYTHILHDKLQELAMFSHDRRLIKGITYLFYKNKIK